MNHRITKKLAKKYGKTPEWHDDAALHRRLQDRQTLQLWRPSGMRMIRLYGYPVTLIAAGRDGMTNPTDVEIIARLLGWEEVKPVDPYGARFSPGCYYLHWTNTDNSGTPAGRQFAGHVPWPDPTDWNDIRRIEDALVGKGLFARYCRLLHMMIPANFRGDMVEDAKRATPEQCVAAAIRVIQGAGL